MRLASQNQPVSPAQGDRAIEAPQHLLFRIHQRLEPVAQPFAKGHRMPERRAVSEQDKQLRPPRAPGQPPDKPVVDRREIVDQNRVRNPTPRASIAGKRRSGATAPGAGGSAPVCALPASGRSAGPLSSVDPAPGGGLTGSSPAERTSQPAGNALIRPVSKPCPAGVHPWMQLLHSRRKRKTQVEQPRVHRLMKRPRARRQTRPRGAGSCESSATAPGERTAFAGRWG